MNDKERRVASYRIDVKQKEIELKDALSAMIHDGAIANADLQIDKAEMDKANATHSRQSDKLKFALEKSSLMLQRDKIDLKWAEAKSDFSE